MVGNPIKETKFMAKKEAPPPAKTRKAKPPVARSIEEFIERQPDGAYVSVQRKGLGIIRLWCNQSRDEHLFLSKNTDATP